MGSITDYGQTGDSVSLGKIDGKPFTIIGVEQSDYREGSGDNEKVTRGVKITTAENFDIDGDQWNRFHSTRVAIVDTLLGEKLYNDINNGGKTFKVRCGKQKSKNGKEYFALEDA